MGRMGCRRPLHPIGPPGPTGATGPAGPAGPPGSGSATAFTAEFGTSGFPPVFLGQTFADVESILVPGGWYVITSKVVLVNASIGLPSLARCVLTRSGSQLDISEVTLADQSGKATLILHGATQVVAGGEHVKLSCQADAPGTASASLAQLTAIQVGALIQPGP